MTIDRNSTLWDRDNLDRSGTRISFLHRGATPCSGKISSSRVLFGGDVQHLVHLDHPIHVRGIVRNVIAVMETDLVAQEAV